MEPVVAVETLLLRAQLPELALRPGTSVVARVLSRGDAQGVITIAGVPLTAQLPDAVGAAGETLRLTVQEVTPERVTLQLEQTPPAADRTAAHEPRTHVTVQDPPDIRRAAGEERHTVALAFHSEALGRLDLRIELAGTTVTTAVEAAPGRPFDLADAAAPRLQDGLHARTGLAAEVRVTPRREPLDVYA